MIRELMASSAPLNMEIFGLIVFTIVFVVIGLWTFRKSGKKFYSSLAELPIAKDGGSDE